MRKVWSVLLTCLLSLCWCSIQTVYAADLKPIVLHPDYNHTKYAPKPTNNDIVRHFRAYTTCFDGDDDDDGDGIPDKWAIPHWVAYEIKQCPGTLSKGPKRPYHGLPISIFTIRGLHQRMSHIISPRPGEKRILTVPN